MIPSGRRRSCTALGHSRKQRPSKVSLPLALGEKPSGCAIWIRVSLDLDPGPFFFFGAAPGKRLPRIAGYKTPRRSTHNKDGVRPERANHRLVPGARFRRMETLEELVTALFGRMPRLTIADKVRELVDAGQTNSQIWSVIQPMFHLADDKKYYPAWYRAAMKRKAARASAP